eukprot:6209008-Pleurochrysis_carterae.AAC.1
MQVTSFNSSSQTHHVRSYPFQKNLTPHTLGKRQKLAGDDDDVSRRRARLTAAIPPSSTASSCCSACRPRRKSRALSGPRRRWLRPHVPGGKRSRAIRCCLVAIQAPTTS